MVTSMLADLMRLMIRQSITGPLAGALSSGLAGLFGATPVASAKGNVFAGPGIAAYESQVVDRPTFFPFAKGIGLMGEAGPEAIMPLTRTASGELGVKAQGAAQVATTPTQIHIHEAPGTTARVEQSADGRRLDVIIEQVEKAIAGRMARGSGMAGFLDGRYRRRY